MTLLECAMTVFPDLDLRRYPGKWNQARRLTRQIEPSLRGQPYWLAVRRRYLELGGGLKAERA